MKTFEERYTAWVDGQLEGEELERFEKELDDQPAAQADKMAAHQLGTVLRKHGPAPAITNAEFFNHQLMARIAGDQPKQKAGIASWLFLSPFARLAWTGIAALTMGWVAGRTLNPVAPTSPTSPQKQPVHLAQVVETRTEDPSISATVVNSDDSVTVLWLDGLEYLPASYELQ